MAMNSDALSVEEIKEANRVANARAETVMTKYRNRANTHHHGLDDGRPPYVDARNLYPFAVERRFLFNWDMGIIKTTFITPKHAAVRGQVFREIKLDPEKIEEIGHVKFNYDRFNKEVEDEDTRVLINDEYTVMISSAEQELSLLQPLTAGAGVYRREKTFEPPKGYIRVDRMVQERVGDKVVVEEYPFNHGVWCKKEGTSNATYFYCCVNDRCRKKPTIIELEMLTSISKIKTIIDRHIREVHWTHLIQLEKFDE